MLKQSIPCIDQLCLCVWEPPRPPASTGCHGAPGRQGEEGIVQARVSVRIPRPHRSFHMVWTQAWAWAWARAWMSMICTTHRTHGRPSLSTPGMAASGYRSQRRHGAPIAVDSRPRWSSSSPLQHRGGSRVGDAGCRINLRQTMTVRRRRAIFRHNE